VKKRILFFVLMVIILTLSACSKDEELPDDELKWIEVNLTINPEKPQPNDPVTFKAAVTYGDEVVTDAREVKFEIWRAKDETHEEIEVKKATDGVYQLEKSFDREGTYYVISHVTAKSMHYMPKKEFVVGTPSEPEDKDAKSQVMEHDSMK
jgi:hypothetical protein